MGKRMNRQHEVLRVPNGWTEQDKALVMQLERIHDDIYNRLLSSVVFSVLGIKPNNDGDVALTKDSLVGAGVADNESIGLVENGDTASRNIAKGQYVIWHGALYIASTVIASGETLSVSNLTAVTNGGLNDLSSKVEKKTLLWRNNSPTTFGGQTLNIDFTDYDGFEVYTQHGHGKQMFFAQKFIVTFFAQGLGESSFYICARSFTVADDKRSVVVSNCGYTYRDGGAGVNNSLHVPMLIYGIKLG